MTDNRGQIYATDIDKRQLAPIHERITRAGARNIQVRTPRGEADVLTDLAGRIDLALIDAPCTGTGAWRRNPDAKWRVRPGALADRLKQQEVLLDRAVSLLKAGGRIAYITCSVLPEENGDQVGAFLDRHRDFTVVPPREVAAASLGERSFMFCQAAKLSDEGVLMTPRTTDTDGFYVAVMRKGISRTGKTPAAALTGHDDSRTYRYARHDPHHRLRLTSYQADRAPGARGKRLLRDRAFPEGRGGAAQLEAERDHPFGRAGFGARQGSATCAGGDLSRPACRCSAFAMASRPWRTSSAARSRAAIIANSAAPKSR